MVFDNYAKYYNLLYKDKDYKKETDYINNLIKKNKSDTKSILDLGCGTGEHDNYFNKKGYKITGIDISDKMINIAKNNYPDIEFYTGDIRNFSLKGRYDAVISLFHVVNYQTSNEDLIKLFETGFNHLKDDGLFIFDFWYGPAVLTDKPVVRIKRLEDDEIKVVRIAEPELLVNENIVNVKYDVYITVKKNNNTEEIKENHKMRYLFYPEIVYMLKQIGFEIIDSYEWMSLENRLSINSWYGVVVAKKVEK